jgi:hypothetical protein
MKNVENIFSKTFLPTFKILRRFRKIHPNNSIYYQINNTDIHQVRIQLQSYVLACKGGLGWLDLFRLVNDDHNII